MEAMLVLFGLIFLILPIVAIVVASNTRSRLNDLENSIGELSQRMASGGRPPRPAAQTAPPAALETATMASEIVDLPVSLPKVVPEPTPKKKPPPEIAPKRPHPPPWPSKPIDWEKIIGVKLFSWMAGIALLIAVIFFLGYSIEHGMLTPPVRMALGIAVGILLLLVCEFRFHKHYPTTANALDGSAIAILFATFYASHSLWDLIPLGVTFGLMILTTAVAVVLSIRRDSRFIALLGLLGGFATPAVLSTGENSPYILFSYLLVLNVGLAWVAQRMRWGFLVILSLVFITIYQWAWVAKFLTLSQLPLAIGIFLIFPIIAFAVIAFGRRIWKGEFTAHTRSFSASACLPVLFAGYLATVPEYGARYDLLFGYLFVICLGLGLVAWKKGPEILHYIGGISALMVFGIWLSVSYTASIWPWMVLIWAGFVMLYLLIPISPIATKQSPPIPMNGQTVASLLFFVPATLAWIEPASADALLFFPPLFIFSWFVTFMALRAGSVANHLTGHALFFSAVILWLVRHGDQTDIWALLGICLLFSLPHLLFLWLAGKFKAPSFRPCAVATLSGFVLLLLFAARHPATVADPLPFLVSTGLLLLGTSVATLFLTDFWDEALFLFSIFLAMIGLTHWTGSLTSPGWCRASLIISTSLAVFAMSWHLWWRRHPVVTVTRFATAALLSAILAQGMAVLCTNLAVGPRWEWWVGVQTVCIIVMLTVATSSRWFAWAIVAVVSSVVAFQNSAMTARDMTGNLAHWGIGTWLYLLFMIYPLLIGRFVQKSILPSIAAIAASAAYFFFAKYEFARLGWQDYIGILPVAQAGLLATHFAKLMRLEPPGRRELGRLALVATAVLAFITVAIPLQLEKQWITIGWALQGAALALLYRKIPHRGLLWYATALLGASFVRLTLNREVLSYYPRSETVILNWYLYTYLVTAASMLASGWGFRKTADDLFTKLRSSTLCYSGGVILLFLLLNIEIADYYSTGTTLTFNFSSTLAQDLTYTLSWGVFAIGLLTAGIVWYNRYTRLVAILLMTVAMVKGFIHDLWKLGGLYRVATFVGLAACLTLVAIALQRFVFKKTKGKCL